MYETSKVASFRSKVARAFIPDNVFTSAKSAKKTSESMIRVTSGRFRPEIDGLRFFAIIPVLFSHLFERVLRQQVNLGFLANIESSNYHYFINHLPGVLLFFAISGYILAYQIINASGGGYDWTKYKKYIIRRFKRIAPPYYVVLIGTYIIIVGFGFNPQGATHFETSDAPLLSSLAASLLYSHWAIYKEWPRLFGPGWTLEIETQYYVIAPMITLLYLSISKKKMRLAIGYGAILLSSILASQYKVGDFWTGTIIKYFPYFFAGILALELQDELKNAARVTPRVITDLLTAAAVFFYLRLQAPENGGGIGMLEYYALNIACVMTMFAAVSIEGNVLRRICINRYVVIIGGACYSIYLTHLQIIFLLTNFLGRHLIFQQSYLVMVLYAVIEVPIAILVGLIFYRLIERPFMMWGRK
jgi:peptidoglycan/LPS O-acetylase OafA/YrhL